MKNQDKTKEELIQDLEKAHQRTSGLEGLEDDRKHAEEQLLATNVELRETRQYLERLIESSPDAIISTNKEGNIVLFNEGAEALLGYRAEEAIGQRVTMLYQSKDSAKEVMRQMRKQGGTISAFETVLRAKNGSRIPVLISASILYDEQGQEAGTVGFSKDLRERKQAEEALKKAHDELEKRVEERTQEIRKLSRAVEQSPSIAIIADADGNIEYVNPKFTQITGYSLEEVIGKNPRILKSGETPPEEYKRLWDTITTDGEWRGEFRNKRKNGESYWAAASISAIKNAEGTISHFLSVQEDISDRKRAEEALRQNEERTRLIVESALDAVITMNAQGLITVWNPQAETIFGWSREGAVGRRLAETIIPPQYREAHDRGLQQFLATGQGPLLNKRIELTALHRDGHEFPVELTISPTRSGDTFTFSAFIHDITERKRAEEELRQAKEAAEAANHAKSLFLTNMGHELRTPLNHIIGYSEMLQEEAEEAGQKEFIPDLQKIRGAGTHLLELINAILDISKIEAGKMDVSPETFTIAPMIQDVVTTIKPLVDKNANTLEVHCADDLGTMRADPTKVRQALLILLSNACKFTERGTIILAVNREFVDGAAWIRFRVTDTGIGMTPEQMGKLFQSFHQADASATRKYGGTGLGLAISQKICQIMGGEITVESTLGQGSTFTISLPTMDVRG